MTNLLPKSARSSARCALLVALVLLGACRAAGPGTPARTVAAFYDKYHGQPGFRATEWSADLLQRLALVRVGKLLGGSDLTNAITGIRTMRALSFVPVSGAARALAAQGLSQEVAGIVRAERYTPLIASSSGGRTSLDYVVRASGDEVRELLATGAVPDAASSFVLVEVEGKFTRAQAEALAKVLPEVARQSAGR